MRFKMAQSEADGLFMKANRKHEILLNFELKRIAVEQKMRERYFAFEKSLMVAHQSKIIARQKALGIYRPKTTPDKKRTATNSFFIANVSMETKGRAKLPPLKETRRKAKPSCDKVSGSASAHENSTRKLFTIDNGSSPDSKHGWSLTELADSAGSHLVDRCLDDSKIMESIVSLDNASVGMENANLIAESDVQYQKDPSSSEAHNSESLSEQKTLIQTVSEKRPNPGKDTISNVKSNLDAHNSRDTTEKSPIDSQQVVEGNDAEKDTEKTQKSTQGESIHNNNNNKSSLGDSEERPTSARSLENGVEGIEGVQAGILNLNLRAQSAGVKAK